MTSCWGTYSPAPAQPNSLAASAQFKQSCQQFEANYSIQHMHTAQPHKTRPSVTEDNVISDEMLYWVSCYISHVTAASSNNSVLQNRSGLHEQQAKSGRRKPAMEEQFVFSTAGWGSPSSLTILKVFSETIGTTCNVTRTETPLEFEEYFEIWRKVGGASPGQERHLKTI